MGRLVIMEVLQDPFRKFKTRWFIDENGKRKLHCMIHLKPLDNKICWDCIDKLEQVMIGTQPLYRPTVQVNYESNTNTRKA